MDSFTRGLSQIAEDNEPSRPGTKTGGSHSWAVTQQSKKVCVDHSSSSSRAIARHGHLSPNSPLEIAECSLFKLRQPPLGVIVVIGFACV